MDQGEAATPEEPPATITRYALADLSCGSSTCPAVYQGSAGMLIIQGHAVSAEHFGIDLPENELLVEVPARLLIDALRALT